MAQFYVKLNMANIHNVLVARAADEIGVPVAEALGYWYVVLTLDNIVPDQPGVYLAEGLPATAADVARVVSANTRSAERVLEAFCRVGLLARAAGVYVVKSEDARVGESKSAARTRNWRERKRHSDGHGDAGCDGHSDTEGDGHGDHPLPPVPPSPSYSHESSVHQPHGHSDRDGPSGSDDDSIIGVVHAVFGRLVMPQIPTDADRQELDYLVADHGEDAVLKYLREAEQRHVRRRGVLPYVSRCLDNARKEEASAEAGRSSSYR